MTTQEIIALENKYILQTYVRPPFVLERGSGVHLYDTDGKRYLDFVSGLSVNAFGYGDPEILKAIGEQASRLIHVSNLYHTIPAPQLARLLVEGSFADRAFFCNSGTESWEAALKFCRKWGHEKFPSKPKYKFIAMHDSFHGRTTGSIATTGQPKYHKGFTPLLPGVDFATLNDLDSVKALVTDETVAILVEPVQAEGGVYPCTPEFLSGLRKLCDEKGMLLVFDEIQCGLGRTGTLFCYQQYGVEPDLMTLAKPLAGSLPIGVCLLRQKVADCIHPGDHAATFGANAVTCATAIQVFTRLSNPDFLAGVRTRSEHLFGSLRSLQQKHPDKIKEVRGRGLIVGIVTAWKAGDIVTAFRDRNILACTAGPDVVRFLPPLVIEDRHIDEAVGAFDDILTKGLPEEKK